MAFNARGEIIRSSSGTISTDGAELQNYESDWGCGPLILIIIIIALMYSFIQTCSTPKSNHSIISKISTDSLAEKNNDYGVGYGKVTFYTAQLDNSEIDVKIDSGQIGTLYTACDKADAICGGYATVSKILTAGIHWVIATDVYGRSCSYNFKVIEGECTILEIKLETPKLRLLDSKILDILSGDWYGKGYQNDTKETWDVILSFNDTTKQFNISYPSLDCVGIWIIDYLATDSIHFVEHIFYGKDQCVDLMVLYSVRL